MKISKFEHALLVVELEGEQLVIDPGSYSKLPELENVSTIVLTHLHDDHSFAPHIKAIKEQFPDSRVFGTSEVANKLKEIAVEVVLHGDRHQVGPFTLDFFGDLHQVIHRSIPLVQNVGVMVNSTLYYPGDSYTIPEQKVELLACPSSAPWLRISDVIDFLEQIRPGNCFSTHNALLSEHGHNLQNGRIREIVEKHGGTYRYLAVGDVWEL
jgi:L-ascorbate metabolism protein UlaG (beta-lactamase superfamily)